MVLEAQVSGDISPDLSRIIIYLSGRPGVNEAPTLGKIRAAIEDGLLARLADEGELALDLAREEAIRREVRDLVDRFGEEVLANDFVRYRADTELSVVIRALLANRDRERPATLASLLEALQDGQIVNTLVGEREIDPDRSQFLITEAQRLIDLHGSDAPAEQFLV
jgi:hypothetical protein